MARSPTHREVLAALRNIAGHYGFIVRKCEGRWQLGHVCDEPFKPLGRDHRTEYDAWKSAMGRIAELILDGTLLPPRIENGKVVL